MNASRMNIAMTENGQLIHLDDDGHRDFTPRVQHAIRYASAAFLSAVLLLAVLIGTGLMPPAPWSPMGEVEQISEEPSLPSLPDDWRDLAPVDPDQSLIEWPEPSTVV